MKVPSSVIRNARKGLHLRNLYGRGGTEIGETTAKKLSSGEISEEFAKHVSEYFPRHANDNLNQTNEVGRPSNGYIAWLLWGGDEARAWLEKKFMRKQNPILTDAYHAAKDFSSSKKQGLTPRYSSFEDWYKSVGAKAPGAKHWDKQEVKDMWIMGLNAGKKRNPSVGSGYSALADKFYSTGFEVGQRHALALKPSDPAIYDGYLLKRLESVDSTHPITKADYEDTYKEGYLYGYGNVRFYKISYKIHTAKDAARESESLKRRGWTVVHTGKEKTKYGGNAFPVYFAGDVTKRMDMPYVDKLGSSAEVPAKKNPSLAFADNSPAYKLLQELVRAKRTAENKEDFDLVDAIDVQIKRLAAASEKASLKQQNPAVAKDVTDVGHFLNLPKGKTFASLTVARKYAKKYNKALFVGSNTAGSEKIYVAADRLQVK